MLKRVGFVSLGCPKNLVDSEVMLGLLDRDGYQITPDPAQAEIIIVNTCGFIDAAKKESIDTILEMAQLKETAVCQKLIVSGCLVERYREEILREIPEVDAVLGTSEVADILKVIGQKHFYGTRTQVKNIPHFLYDDTFPRVLTTPRYSAYVKIAEGCDHPCTFCVIPKMRGGFRSRRIDSVAREVRSLAAQGVREVNLVAQDSTMYGEDLGMRDGLAQLLQELNTIDSVQWIRFLYAYPNKLSPAIIQAVGRLDKVCKYFDIPLQHASGRVLKAMLRGGNRKSLLSLVGRIRAEIPEATIRTSFIVGFPGETEEDFEELMQFVREARFDRVGVFTYSDEEETAAYGLSGSVADNVRRRRRSQLMKLQSKISLQKNRALVGRMLEAIVEGLSPESDLLLQGRLRSQAPEIDGALYIQDGPDGLQPGDLVTVEVTEAHEYDLVGRVVETAPVAVDYEVSQLQEAL